MKIFCICFIKRGLHLHVHCAGCEHDPVRHGGVLPVPAVRRGLRRVRGQRALHRHPQRGAQVRCDWSVCVRSLVLQKVASELHPKVCKHGEGPY